MRFYEVLETREGHVEENMDVLRLQGAWQWQRLQASIPTPTITGWSGSSPSNRASFHRAARLVDLATARRHPLESAEQQQPPPTATSSGKAGQQGAAGHGVVTSKRLWRVAPRASSLVIQGESCATSIGGQRQRYTTANSSPDHQQCHRDSTR